MLVVSACPLPVASLLWQSQPSTWALTVVCRATITLLPGESVLADQHEDPAEHDEYWDDDEARSLRAPSDLVPMKPRADVTLVGHAFAPGGKPTRSVVAHLLVGELSKSIEVVADRWFDQEGALHDGPQFTRMPLVYERAAGGPGTPNPVGTGATPNRYGRIALPNLQPPGTTVDALDDYIPPVGFGPLAPGWPSRRDRLGRAAVTGTPPDLKRPLAEDLDPQYFNHAPRDQQVQLLRDRERLILEHLHPEHPRFVTDLPSVRPRAMIVRHGRSHPVPLRCDTLWIDTDRALCTLTWRAQVPLKSADEPGRVVITLDNPGQTGSRVTSDLGRLQLRPFDPEVDTMVPERGTAQADKVLPFTKSAPASPRLAPEDKPALGAGLPFVAAPPPPSPPPSVPAMAPYPMSPPAIPPAIPLPPLPPPLPAARGSQPASELPAPAPEAAYPPIAPPARPSLWSIPEAAPGAGGVAPLTVGQLAAVPVKPTLPPVRPPTSAPPPLPPAESRRKRAAEGSAEARELREPREPRDKAEPREPRTPRAATTDTALPAGAPAPGAEAKPEGRRALQLVYFDPESLPRLRRKPVFQPILLALEERPLDSDLDDPSIARDPVAVEDRRDVFEVLARGEITDEPGLEDALDRAVREDGKFVSPFLLVGGELRFSFDDLSALRATISLALPFASGDDALKLAIGDARDLVTTPDLLSPAGLAERFSARILEAFRKARRQVAPGYLEEQVERALLEKRLYQRREVFGAPHVRALLTLATPARPWPVYVPEVMARKLPMFARFTARILVDGHLQEDQFESHPHALRALAMARVVPLVGRGELREKGEAREPREPRDKAAAKPQT